MVARIGDVVNHVGKPHVVDTVIVTSNGCHAMLMPEKGKPRRVVATSHTTDDRWCIAALSMADQPDREPERLNADNTKPVRIQMTHETYQRMVIMCRERDVSADFLIHTLLWDAKEGGICQSLDE